MARQHFEVPMIPHVVPAAPSRAFFLAFMVGAGPLLLGVKPGGAQQFVVDDAGITDPGALGATTAGGPGTPTPQRTAASTRSGVTSWSTTAWP
jgi:hypothetical protein